MKKQINPTIKAHLIRGAFYLLLLLVACAIPFALAQRNAAKRGLTKPVAKANVAANMDDLPRATGPMTLPDAGTVEVPETNSRWGKASAWYSAVNASICFRNCSARSLIDIRILKASMTNEKWPQCCSRRKGSERCIRRKLSGLY